MVYYHTIVVIISTYSCVCLCVNIHIYTLYDWSQGFGVARLWAMVKRCFGGCPFSTQCHDLKSAVRKGRGM